MTEDLTHTDDVATQMQKMLNATNEKRRLILEALIPAGKILNEAKIELLKAETFEQKRDAKILIQKAKGKYKEIEARIDAEKETINSCKIAIKAEGSHL